MVAVALKGISVEASSAKRSAAVYDAILKLIVTGEFAEGERLPSEMELATQFQASRPVVREALARLRDDGLIISRRGSGSYVTQRPDEAVLKFSPLGSIADIQRCFEFRVDLEGAAAARAAERWEGADLADIHAAYEELEACIRNAELGVEADAKLHLAIARATHNDYHLSTQLTLQSHIKVGMNVTRNISIRRPVSRLRLVQNEHAAIIAAIEQRAPSQAREAMQTHLEKARMRMFEGSSENQQDH